MSDNTAVALIVITIALGLFGAIAFEDYNETKIATLKTQFKIDSLKTIGEKQ